MTRERQSVSTPDPDPGGLVPRTGMPAVPPLPPRDRSPGDPLPPLRIGVSACLLGQEVRFDGGHKHDRWLTGTLAQYCELVPVCPEVEVGMSIPRESVRLEGDADSPRMVAPRSGVDWTAPMNAWSRRRVRELAAEDLDGFVFKKNSPSCGLFRVKVYPDKGMPARGGRGLFAAAFAAACPLVPVEEEGRLEDARLRENFVERLFAWRRVKDAFAGRWARGGIVAFHSREKYLLMAHSPRHYQELGRLVARIGHPPAARQRAAACRRTPARAGHGRRAEAGAGRDRGLRPRPGAPGGAGDPAAPLRRAAGGPLRPRPGLPEPPPARVDAPQSRLNGATVVRLAREFSTNPGDCG
jgi:uncharacterized protein YbbK (DUF523 family)